MRLSLPLPCATIALFALVFITPSHALPLQLYSRAGISQNSQDAIAPFKSLCNSLENGQRQPRCNDFISRVQEGILAAANVCAQQDGADQLIDLAHSLNSTELVKMAQLWMQQPRSSVCTPSGFVRGSSGTDGCPLDKLSLHALLS